jgi:hypothetical protein
MMSNDSEASNKRFDVGGDSVAGSVEPAAVQFLRLLWRRKLLIVGGSLAATVAAALVLYLWPQKYTVTFVYEHPVTESEYNVLVRRFYSKENLTKIAGQLREKGLARCAKDLLECPTERSLEKLIRFAASPVYPRRLQTTDPATSEKISSFQAQLLSITITSRSRQDVEVIASVVTGNFEYVLPLYAIRIDLKDLIRRLQTSAAEIEDNRFTLAMDLEEQQARYEKLKALESPGSDGGASQASASGDQTTLTPADQDKLVLQFSDVESTREFLPLAYQMRALQSRIIDLQETIKSNKDRYDYCVMVLEATGKLLSQVEQRILTPYTVEQFLGFVGEQLLASKDSSLADYLKSYIRKTENLVSANTRAGESPVIYPVPKHLAGRSALVFVASLMVLTFVSVLAEYGRGRSGRDRMSAA